MLPDAEVRVPPTEPKTSFPAAPRPILRDLPSRICGRCRWEHRTKTAGQPEAKVLVSPTAVFAEGRERPKQRATVC